MSLYDSFKGVCEKETALAPYSNRNLYSTIHLSENDHTQILWDIIRYRKNGKYVFFESFIKKCLHINIGMREKNVLSEPKATQYKALSNKGKDNKKSYGFIDLLLKDDEFVIIIENKVCDASDGKNQLTRYFYTFAKCAKDDIESLKTAKVTIDSSNKNTYVDDKIYVVYLSKDESTVFPSKDSYSLPDFLQKRLKLINSGDRSLYEKEDYSIPDVSHYIHISYTNDLLPWLKDHVLPEISAYNSQEFFRSMYLYVDYLENDLLGQTQKSRDIYIAEVYNNIVDVFYQDTKWSEVWLNLYKELVDQKKKNNTLKDEDLQVRNAYIIFLRAQLNKILNDHLANEWKAYCTPSFILLYKEEWRTLSPNTDIPVLNLYLSPSCIKNLLSGKKQNSYNISFNIERVKSDPQEWKTNLIQKLNDIYNNDYSKTNREQVFRYKEAYSITYNDDLRINCEKEKIEEVLSKIINKL